MKISSSYASEDSRSFSGPVSEMAQEKGSSTPGKLFRVCPGCQLQNVFKEDEHSFCLYCLHEDKTRVEKDCAFCGNMSERTMKDRHQRLANWLQGKSPSGEKKRKSERSSKTFEGAPATGAQHKAKNRESAGTGSAERSGSTGVRQGAPSPAPSTTSQRSGSGKRKAEHPAKLLERPRSSSKAEEERGSAPSLKDKAVSAPKVVKALIHPTKPSIEKVAAALAQPMEATPVVATSGPRISLPPRRESSFVPIDRTPVKLPVGKKKGGQGVVVDSTSASEEELIEVLSHGLGVEEDQPVGVDPDAGDDDDIVEDTDGAPARPSDSPLPAPQDNSAAILLAIQSLCSEIRTRLPLPTEEPLPSGDPEPGPSGVPPTKKRRIHPPPPFQPSHPVQPSSPSTRGDDTGTDTAATGTGDEAYDENIPSSPPARASPPDEIGSFHSMISRASELFQLCPEEKKKEGFLYQRREAKRKTVLAVPLLDDISDEGLTLLKNPSTTPARRDRYEKKYRVPDTAPLCLRAQPTPDSVVSAAARKKAGGVRPPHRLPRRTARERNWMRWDAESSRRQRRRLKRPTPWRSWLATTGSSGSR